MFSFAYKFEGSSEQRHVMAPTERITGEDLCQLIVKDIFGESTPPCELIADVEETDWRQLVTIKRIYGNKFQKTGPTKAKKTVKVRRWRSRSPERKRWRSPVNRPVNRHMPVYREVYF